MKKDNYKELERTSPNETREFSNFITNVKNILNEEE